MGTQCKDLVDTRRVLTWKEEDAVKTAKARLVLKEYQNPDLRNGNVDIAGSVSLRSSYSQLMSPGALKSGRFGARISRRPFARRTDLIARYIFVLHAKGIPRKLAGYGGWGPPVMVSMTPQLHFIGPCIITW